MTKITDEFGMPIKENIPNKRDKKLFVHIKSEVSNLICHVVNICNSSNDSKSIYRKGML